jgi:hypothetical protein
MKRLLPIALLLTAVLFLPAWGQEPLAHPYYPLKVGSRWTYRTGKDQVVITAEKEEAFTYKPGGAENKDNPDKTEKVTGVVLKITSGSKVMQEKVAVLKDGVYRFAAAGKTITPPLCFFKLPLKAGETWKVDSTSEGKTIKGTFVGGEETINVPLKGGAELKTMTVASKDFQVDGEPMDLKYWFAPNYGLVKQHAKVGTFTVTLELEQYTPGK